MVLVAHLVLSVFAALGICVDYMCVCVMLDRLLVCLVLAVLWLYVKLGAWRAPDAKGEWLL